MAKGKNKQTVRKGNKKSDKHAFLKKEWYRLLTPPGLEGNHAVGWVPANKTIGKKLSRENVLDRVCEVSLADLKNDNALAHRKIKMQIEEVEGKNLYTSFYGLDSTRETVCKTLKKRQTLIDVWVDVKTKDDYILRVFVTLTTKRAQGQHKKNSYAKSSQVRLIRKRLSEKLLKYSKESTHSKIAKEVFTNKLDSDLVSTASRVFPINSAIVRKIKVLKKANVDVRTLAKESKQAGAKADNEHNKKKQVTAPAADEEAAPVAEGEATQ